MNHVSRFFFITSYDAISGKILSELLNLHPEIACHLPDPDVFFPGVSCSNANKSIDQFIHQYTSEKKISGSAQSFSAFELQHRSLVEKTQHPYRKANILVSPALRINFLLQHWMRSNTSIQQVLDTTTKHMRFDKERHPLLNLYGFDHFYKHLIEAIKKENISPLTSLHDQLFVIALAVLMAFDTADILAPGKSFSLESLLSEENQFLSFMNYLANQGITISDEFTHVLKPKLRLANDYINEKLATKWESWQTHLLNFYLNQRLKTLFYPHIDQPLNQLYLSAGLPYASSSIPKVQHSKLISIQLNSNRPAQLAAYFDNIEETADHPQEIEVLVNIDDDDVAMESLIKQEIPTRKFTLKYIKTPRPKSFCDLWQPINKLLEITDQNCYFLLNISDEMLFITQGWDTLLKKYVGFFPDHLFRLRASRNKFRNYFDAWECSFAQDSIPITTKKMDRYWRRLEPLFWAR